MVKLSKKKIGELEEGVNPIQLDPDDLDCCGVNRPIEDTTCCTSSADCNNLCSSSNGCCTIPANSTPIDETMQAVDFCPSPEDPIVSLDLNVADASQTVVSGSSSNFTVADFSDTTSGYSGKVYTGLADDQIVRLHFSFAVPSKLSTWDTFFLKFYTKTEGVLADSTASMTLKDVDAVARYSLVKKSSTDWMLLRVGNTSQSISSGRWTVGSSMSIIIDVHLSNGGKVYISNGIFNYR